MDEVTIALAVKKTGMLLATFGVVSALSFALPSHHAIRTPAAQAAQVQHAADIAAMPKR